VPVLKTEAMTGEGVDHLIKKLDEHRAYVIEEGELVERRRRHLGSEVVGITAARLRRSLDQMVLENSEVAELIDEVAARRLDPASVASELFDRITGARA
jgi:LAO/AO transport system kinase